MLSKINETPGLPQNVDLQSIRGKVVLITGGAAESGAAIARLLALRGARVFIAAASTAEFDWTLADSEIRNEITGLAADLSRPETVRQLFDEVERRFGIVDILINNTPGMNAQSDRESSRNLCTQEAIIRMQGKSDARIVNINDPAAHHNSWTSSAGAVRTRSLAAALRRQARELGIRVTSIEHEAHEFGVEDVARCVLESLVQPYGIDIIYLTSQVPVQ
jgi:NAD(P)-dependent dehydrogenase (short-subunit alcohol dehydrogenase family)